MAWVDITERILPALPQAVLCVVPTGVRFNALLVGELRKRGLRKFKDGCYLNFWCDEVADKIAIKLQTDFGPNAFVLRSSSYLNSGAMHVHSAKLARQLTKSLNGARYRLLDEKIKGVDWVFQVVSSGTKTEHRRERRSFIHNGVVFTEAIE